MGPQITKPLEQLQFDQKADSFELGVIYAGDKKLTVTLKDYVDWIIYFRQYTEEDGSKEFHKKMELIDVYTAFSQTKPQCDEEYMKIKDHEAESKKYEFGTIVESENTKLPCYKIERGGKLTAYLSMIDARTSKQVTYESNLILNKVRNMTEAEKSAEKIKTKENEIIDLKKQVQTERKEKEQLQKRVIKLQEMLRLSRQEIEELSQTKHNLEATNKRLNQANEELEAKFQAINRGLVGRNQQLLKKPLKQQQELNAIKSQQQQEVEQIIMKKAGVDSWTKLSARIRLVLGGSGLTKLPDQIGNLTQLTELWLGGNKLSEVPSTLANLTNLQQLGLDNNQLKEVPECIGKLTNLQLLGLGGNQLKEVPEMVRLVQLKELSIHNNQLSVFPLWIAKLQQLERLDMYGNKMMIADVSVVMGLKQLKILWMSKYQVESQQKIQQLQQLCQQRKIKLGWN